MGRALLALIGLSMGLAACAPEDPNVKPARRDNYRQTKIEKNQVKGLDYIQYSVYRLAEIKQVVEAAISEPEKLKKFSGSACGQLVVDRISENRRVQRFETVNCTIHNDDLNRIYFKADGVDVIESSRAADGALERLWMRSVVPHQITGNIRQNKEKTINRADSSAAVRERRELSLDLVRESEGAREYRFSYSVDLNWRQEIVGENFQAFEDNANSLLVLTGSMVIAGQSVEQIQLDLGRLETFAPRTVKERAKYTKGRKPDDQTFRKVSLLLKAGKGEGDDREALRFDKAACGLPWGALEVADYEGQTDKDDKLKTGKEKGIGLSAMGIEVKATGQIRSWPDCTMDATDSIGSDLPVYLRGERFKAQAGEIRNRIPYHEILFK